jgi:NAD(P)-dependent dehydrogenase (short-subunit alcohol dehydrogenase family)
MRVAIADVEESALAETAELVPGGALVVPTDVGRRKDVDTLAERTFDEFGAVHLLCNNAGVFQGGLLWERSEADWKWALGVNVWGIINGISAFVPRMLAGGEPGHVVNTASMAGLVSMGYSGVYCMTKFAAVALSESLHHDLRLHGSSIGVSVLCPSLINTRIGESRRNRPDALPGEISGDAAFVEQALRDSTATGISPDEVAGIVLDAIGRGDFYIGTKPSFDDQVRTHYEDVLARRPPSSPAID